MKYILLIADDSTLVKKNIKRLLNGLTNLEIHDSENIQDTKSKIDTLSPDILILDLKMPDGNGYEVLNYTNTLSKKPVVIILSNFASDDTIQRCLDDGADYFFDKSKEHVKAISVIKDIIKVSK